MNPISVLASSLQFGRRVPKTNDARALFVLELLPDQKEKAGLSQFVLGQILEKNTNFRFSIWERKFQNEQ